MTAPMTPERLAKIREELVRWGPCGYSRVAEELVSALETERARLEWLGTTFEARRHPRVHRLLDSGGTGDQLRAAIDDERAGEKGAGR